MHVAVEQAEQKRFSGTHIFLRQIFAVKMHQKLVKKHWGEKLILWCIFPLILTAGCASLSSYITQPHFSGVVKLQTIKLCYLLSAICGPEFTVIIHWCFLSHPSGIDETNSSAFQLRGTMPTTICLPGMNPTLLLWPGFTVNFLAAKSRNQ